MRKLWSIFLVLSLFVLLSVSAFAEVEDPGSGIWNAAFSGFTLKIPDACRTASGFIHFFDFGGGLEYEGTGILYSCVYYSGMTEYERLEVVDEIDMAFLMEEWDLVGELEMELEKKQLELFSIYVTAKPWSVEELRAFLRTKAVDSAKERRDEAEADFYMRAWDLMNLRVIGEKDGFRYYLAEFAPETVLEKSAGNIEESYLTECFSLLSKPELITDNITLTTPLDEASIAYYSYDENDVMIDILF